MYDENQMTIVHVLHAIRDRGNGIANVVVDLACSQAEAGHSVTVAAADGSFRGLLESSGVQVVDLPVSRNPLTLIMLAWRFRRLIRQLKPDIVHVHVLAAIVLARMLRWRDRYRIVGTVHVAFRRDSALMGLADAVIAVSAANIELLASRGIPRRKLHVIRNAPIGTLRRPSAANAVPAELQRPAIVTVAGLYMHKGIDVAIEAFAKLAESDVPPHLYIVGDGPDRETFTKQAAATVASSRIHFVGFTPEPERYLIASDIFVLPSRHESLALAILEARAAGCAVIASATGGIPEALDFGDAGILVPVGDANAISDAIMALLGDPDLLATYRERAMHGLAAFQVHRMAEETFQLYRSLLGRNAISNTPRIPTVVSPGP